MRKFLLISTLLFLITGYGAAQTADFSIQYSSGRCASAGNSVMVDFVATIGALNTADTVEWNFGDGTIQIADHVNQGNGNMVHAYSAAGTYTVVMRVVYNNGTVITANHAAVIYPAPVFAITKSTADSVCPGVNITFNCSLISPANANAIQGYMWEFGDGGSSNTRNPTKSYPNAANVPTSFDIRLTVQDTSGCSGRIDSLHFIHVRRKPVVKFHTDIQNFCYSSGNPTGTPHFINYTDTGVSGTNNTYLWDFGDGNTSTTANPSHTYNPGTYNVTLTATNQYGCSDSLQIKNFIRVVKMDPNYTISNNGNDTIVCKVPDTIRIDGVTGNNYRWSIPTTDIGNTYSGRTYQPKFYSSHVGSHKVIVEITDIGSGCKLTDSSITIHVYREIDAVATITDTNECDPAHSIRFQNGTQYPWPDDFGFAVTTWDFGDGSPTVNSHDITRTYANYGDYRVAMTAITPYGCLLKTVYQDVHIFEMRALAAISDPAPPSPPDGCAPHTVEITHILDSLKSSHPIVSYLWSFDFNGDKSDVLIGNATDDVVNHTYPDTGKFDVYLTLTNSAGCSIDIFVNQIKVGHPPRVGFTFESDTNCKSEINIRVMAFDSVDAYDNLVPGDSAYADDWQWIDPESGNPVATGDTTTITPTVVGKPYEIILQASHNGCPSEFPIQLEVGYMCPPLASIKEPKDRPDGSPPLLCGIETVNFVPDDAGGAIWMKWFAGDVMDPKDAADTSKQTSSGWLHKDSTTAGAWEFLYSDSVIEALDGMFTITLMTYNDSSSSDPKYFNLCGYCEDMAQKQLLISYAKMNFTLNQETVCERDSIVFYDSTYSNVGLFGWGFKFDYAQDTNNVEDYMKENGSFAPDKMAEFANYTPMPSKGTGGKMYFSKPNRYRAVLIDTCAFTCVRYDTLYFTVYPKSDPGYLTSLDSVSFRRRNQDTLCFNSNDPLYVQDNSSTRWPFDTTKIVKWRWILDKDTQYTQNAALYVVNGAGLYTLGLQVTNEYGCAEQELDVNNDRNQVLVAEVDASFEAGGGKNEFCNQSEISFENRSMVYPNSVYATGTTIIKTVWDWGDGTTDSTFTLIPNIYGSGAYPKAYHTYHFQTPVNKVGVTMRVSVYGPGGPIGCEDVYTDSLTISGPVADFTTDDLIIYPCPDDNGTGERGRRIQFRNQSLGNVVTLIWNFGDTLGGSSNRTIGPITDSAYVAPIHTYDNAGYYGVLLVVLDDKQCSDSLYKDDFIQIEGPIGIFDYTPFDGCISLPVNFKATIPDEDQPHYRPDSLYFYPGNGSVLVSSGTWMGKTPVSTAYRTAGAYVPMMRLIKTVNGLVCNVDRYGKDTIYAIELKPDFDTAALYCPNTPITFPNTTTWIPTVLPVDSISWQWTLGRGDTSRLMEASTQYDTAGFYNVKLTAKLKSCEKSKSYRIEVINIPEPVFFPPQADACDGLEVEFRVDSLTEEDKSRIVSYEWTFSDGETFEGNPINREFTVSGEYPYEVKITFLPDACSKIYTDTVTVFAYKSPVAAFTPDPTEGEVGSTFTFTDNSTPGDGDIVRWFWDFGDGNQSPDSLKSTIPYVYDNVSGIVLITLHIVDEFGCHAAAENQVLVIEKLGFPNLFTIGGDCGGRKCEFRPLEDKGFFNDFKMEIYDRWGMLVWSKHCQGDGCPDYGEDFWWDGTNKKGKKVANGVYYWVVYASPRSEAKPFVKNGSITVLGGE